jgi:hypothetical protein
LATGAGLLLFPPALMVCMPTFSRPLTGLAPVLAGCALLVIVSMVVVFGGAAAIPVDNLRSLILEISADTLTFRSLTLSRRDVLAVERIDDQHATIILREQGEALDLFAARADGADLEEVVAAIERWRQDRGRSS